MPGEKRKTPAMVENPGPADKINVIEYGKEYNTFLAVAQSLAGGSHAPTRISCHLCVFYREIPYLDGFPIRLCQLTGEKKPYPGINGCHFIAGAWANIDAILGLTGKGKKHKVEVPNNKRRSGGLYHSQDGKNSGFFDLKSNSTCYNRHGYKLRYTSGNPRGPAASCWPGNVCRFLYLKKP